jgi:integral membrane sensor domain MASE1
LSPFTFTLEGFVIASFLVNKSIASTHVSLVFSINRDASELISDWWLGWVSVRVVIGNPLALIVT